jgi:hypothetical protein
MGAEAEGMATAARFTELVEMLDSSRSKMLQWLEKYDIIILSGECKSGQTQS